MRRLILTSLLAATAAIGMSVPAAAQSRQDEARFDAAQQRFDREYDLYQQEVSRYRSSRGGYGQQGYAPPPGYQGQGGYYADDRDEGGYDAARYYRGGPNYQERTLAANDRVYRGNDGRYYCKRNDGTTGLIIGAAGGGVLGNVIDGGHSRTAGTLIGGALGALAGRSIDQSNTDIRCR